MRSAWLRRDTVATGGSTGTVRYAYDALGRRASRTDAGGTTYTLWAGDDLAATLTGSGAATALYTFYPGIDQPHSVRLGGPGAATAYYATDAEGTVVGLMDASGAPLARYGVGPYGEVGAGEIDSGSVVTALRFKSR